MAQRMFCPRAVHVAADAWGIQESTIWVGDFAKSTHSIMRNNWTCYTLSIDPHSYAAAMWNIHRCTTWVADVSRLAVGLSVNSFFSPIYSMWDFQWFKGIARLSKVVHPHVAFWHHLSNDSSHVLSCLSMLLATYSQGKDDDELPETMMCIVSAYGGDAVLVAVKMRVCMFV